MSKSPKRLKAEALRAQGLSYNEIHRKLGVSKGSLSLWLRGISLDRHAVRRLERRKQEGAKRGAASRAQEKQQRQRPEKRISGHPKWKGEIAETAFIARCVRQRIPVSIPVGDNTPYDALVDVGGTIKKVQVKTITFDPYDNNRVSIRRSRYANGKMVTKVYEDGDFDIFVGYCPERDIFILLPWKDIPASGTLGVHFDSAKCKYRRYVENWALLGARPTSPNPR